MTMDTCKSEIFWNTNFGKTWSKKSKLSVYDEIRKQAQVVYAEFNCEVKFFCFGPKIPFLEKFGLKIQNCLK